MIGTPAYTYPGGTLTSSQYGNVISTDGSQGTFTPQDRGNVILLPGCGLKGAAFYAIILAVVSPTAVVVDMPCLNSTVGAGNTLTIFGLRSTNDGSIAAGGFVLSAPGALWSYWDIGAWVSVAGANADGTALVTQVAGYGPDGNSMTLLAPAGTAVSGALVQLAPPGPLRATITGVDPAGAWVTLDHPAAFAAAGAGLSVRWGTDDTQALQASIDALEEYGTWHAGPGTYLVSVQWYDSTYGGADGVLQIQKNHVTLEARGVRLLLAGGETRNASGIIIGDLATGYHDVVVRDLHLDWNCGEGQNPPSSMGQDYFCLPAQNTATQVPLWAGDDFCGAVMIVGQYCAWQNSGVPPTTTLGASPTNARTTHVSILGCTFEHVSHGAVITVSYAERVIVERNLFDGGGRWSSNLHIDGAFYYLVAHNTFLNNVPISSESAFLCALNGDTGYRPTYMGEFTGNWFLNTAGNTGCLSGAMYRCNVHGNYFVGCSAYAILLGTYSFLVPPPMANGIQFCASENDFHDNYFIDCKHGIEALSFGLGTGGTCTPVLVGVLDEIQPLVTGGPYGSNPTVTIDPPPGWTVDTATLKRATALPVRVGGAIVGYQITSRGLGYHPTVTIDPPRNSDGSLNAAGVQAVGIPIMLGDGLFSLILTVPGNGYNYGVPGVVLSVPAGGVAGTAHAVMSPLNAAIVGSLVVDTSGSGYAPKVTVQGPGGSGTLATAVARLSMGLGSVTVTSPAGSLRYPVPPLLLVAGGGGSGASGHVTMATGYVSRILPSNNGQNYSTAPTLLISGDGTGAAAHCTVAFGQIAKIIIDNPGINYTYATVAFQGGGGSGAAATVVIAGSVFLGVGVVAAGGGYAPTDQIAWSGGGGSGLVTLPKWVDDGTGQGTCMLAGLSGQDGLTPPTLGAGYTSAPMGTITNSSGGPPSGSGAIVVAAIEGNNPNGALIDDPGHNYTSLPSTWFMPTGWFGAGASAHAVYSPSSGTVLSVVLDSPGIGYLYGAILTLVGGGGGTGAVAIVGVDANGSLINPAVVFGGKNYTTAPTVLVTPATMGHARGNLFHHNTFVNNLQVTKRAFYYNLTVSPPTFYNPSDPTPNAQTYWTALQYALQFQSNSLSTDNEFSHNRVSGYTTVTSGIVGNPWMVVDPTCGANRYLDNTFVEPVVGIPLNLTPLALYRGPAPGVTYNPQTLAGVGQQLGSILAPAMSAAGQITPTLSGPIALAAGATATQLFTSNNGISGLATNGPVQLTLGTLVLPAGVTIRATAPATNTIQVSLTNGTASPQTVLGGTLQLGWTSWSGI
jgi:hypothetical protein